METMEKTQFIDKVVSALRNAAIEMEEFQVKIALGKADVEDKYEDIKNRFNLFIHESKFKINVGKEKLEDLNTKFDELLVQLTLGKTEGVEAFKKQKKQLLLTLHEIEVKIKANETLKRVYAFVLIEIEKFKVFLDVLEQKYDIGKVDAKDAFEKGKVEFDQFIERLKSRHSEEKEPTKMEYFQDEISEAFTNFKNAFKKP